MGMAALTTITTLKQGYGLVATPSSRHATALKRATAPHRPCVTGLDDHRGLSRLAKRS
jgi:hypothetical protein